MYPIFERQVDGMSGKASMNGNEDERMEKLEECEEVGIFEMRQKGQVYRKASMKGKEEEEMG